jgi:predicted amidophosphoribosyltransferase
MECPRCSKPMTRHNGRGRRPACCEACRTPSEMAELRAKRKHNETVRNAKKVAKQITVTDEPTTFAHLTPVST